MRILVIFEVFMAVSIMITVFWDATPFILVQNGVNSPPPETLVSACKELVVICQKTGNVEDTRGSL
jgi:hypothetical protein